MQNYSLRHEGHSMKITIQPESEHWLVMMEGQPQRKFGSKAAAWAFVMGIRSADVITVDRLRRRRRKTSGSHSQPRSIDVPPMNSKSGPSIFLQIPSRIAAASRARLQSIKRMNRTSFFSLAPKAQPSKARGKTPGPVVPRSPEPDKGESKSDV